MKCKDSILQILELVKPKQQIENQVSLYFFQIGQMLSKIKFKFISIKYAKYRLAYLIQLIYIDISWGAATTAASSHLLGYEKLLYALGFLRRIGLPAVPALRVLKSCSGEGRVIGNTDGP